MSPGIHRTGSPASAFETVRDALQAAGRPIRPHGAQVLMASCPLHTDHTPSLSVTWRQGTRAGAGGAVRLHCFSCRAHVADIAAALGLRLHDLFDHRASASATPRVRAPDTVDARIGCPAAPYHRQPADRPPPVAAGAGLHLHHHQRAPGAAGHPLRMPLRRPAAQAIQQRYRHDRHWVYRKPEGFTPALYRPGAITEAAQAAMWLWVTEGEEDADTLAGLGRPATTTAQGAERFRAPLRAPRNVHHRSPSHQP